MILPLTYYGNPILEQIAVKVVLNVETTVFIENLLATMYHYDGVGIAAPQVGKSWRIFCVDTVLAYNDMTEDHRKKHFKQDTGIKEVFINPQIKRTSITSTVAEEGCLSLPGIWMDIARPDEIEIEYTNQLGIQKTATFEGYTARIIQHEYDHIEGILLPHRLTPTILSYYKKQLNTLKNKKFN